MNIPRLLRLRSRKPGERQRIPILTYHQVDVLPTGAADPHDLVVSPRAFLRQMQLLVLLGYRGVSMSELEPYLQGQRTGRVVGLTFDDGYLNNLQHALPVLKHFGFTSTCYVVSAQVGASNVWDHASGAAPQPLMNAGELRSWLQGGQEVGAHSRHHVDLTQCSPECANEEIAGCRDDLEELLGIKVRHFCYPYGKFNASHLQMARQAGYLTATTLQGGRSKSTDDLLALPRLRFDVRTALALAVAALDAGPGAQPGESGLAASLNK